MMKRVFIRTALILGVLLVIVALQPSTFRVSRSATVAAPPAAVFAQVNDFHKWDAWNPWAKIDPAMKQTFEGPAAGKGAVYIWAGNAKAGEGRMTIAESVPNERIVISLEFLKPMKATNTAEFTFKPEGPNTVVTWSMYGTKNLVSKFMGLIMSMDRMLGREFEKGLASMKTAAEAQKPSNSVTLGTPQK